MPDRVLLVTGSSGIAAATVRLAVSAGARVVVVGMVQEELDRLSTELSSVVTVPGDLLQAAVADGAVARCVELYGRVDAVFNVAGLSGRRFGDGPLHECTDEGWSATLDGNLLPTFHVCRAAIRQMLAQPLAANGLRGSILNMASVLAFAPRAPEFATHAYAAAKGAIISLSRSLAAYYAPHGIRVNAIAPGLVRTPMSARAQQDPAILDLMRTKQPLTGTLLEAEDIARAALFLLGDDAAAIVGQTLAVDAGWTVS